MIVRMVRMNAKTLICMVGSLLLVAVIASATTYCVEPMSWGVIKALYKE